MNILLVDVYREKNEGFVLVIEEINTDEGTRKRVSKNMKDETNIQSFSQMAMNLSKTIIDKKPNQVIFDTHGVGIGLRDEFHKLAGEGWLNFIVDEKGNLFFRSVIDGDG